MNYFNLQANLGHGHIRMGRFCRSWVVWYAMVLVLITHQTQYYLSFKDPTDSLLQAPYLQNITAHTCFFPWLQVVRIPRVDATWGFILTGAYGRTIYNPDVPHNYKLFATIWFLTLHVPLRYVIRFRQTGNSMSKQLKLRAAAAPLATATLGC